MRKSSHAQYDVQIHLVWTTKYRYRVLVNKIAERAREIIRRECSSMGVEIIRGSVGREHIHLLISIPPSLSISRIVQQLKRKSAKILFREYKELRKRYWGRNLWSKSYFCRSVGYIAQEVVKEYIENGQDEYEDNFKIVG